MNELSISNVLYEKLKNYGAIKWHKNENHSFYIKFKDTRLGSIRIANHGGRSRYNYKYEIITVRDNVNKKINEITSSIINKSLTIQNFDPNKYVIYDPVKKTYKEISCFVEYRDRIKKKLNIK